VQRAQPFKVAIPEEQLADLRRRLRGTRWPEDLGNEDWRYGVERGWMEEMTRYWVEDFDWRAQERVINRLPQYTVELGGIRVHFVHVLGAGCKRTPVILTHGWPWTFLDWKDVIEPLAGAGYDVVVPSLPGFGFSVPLQETGVAAPQVASRWLSLMHDVLGYKKFAAAGGDWGALVTAELGHRYPEQLLGVYLLLPWLPGVDLRSIPDEAFADDERWMVERRAARRHTTHSHRAVHTYEPETISYALADSPTGAAAWLWARRRDWSDCDGELLTAFDREFLCTNASIYWLTGTVATSLRLYAEQSRLNASCLPETGRRLIDAPTGFGIFPKDVLMMPRALAEELTNLWWWSPQPRGGHFAPAEQPRLVIDELLGFFELVRG
jgi:pimeloyl-ACP methyl ester carboxylesterase